jgi:hypothetical protein
MAAEVISNSGVKQFFEKLNRITAYKANWLPVR